jgi:hypothetical protein
MLCHWQQAWMMSRLVCPNLNIRKCLLIPIDRASSSGAQATVEANISTYHTQLGTAVFHWERAVHPSVSVWLHLDPCPNPKPSDGLSYLLADNIVYLTIADKSYPRKLAFSYLEELSKEFSVSYGPKVETVRKPYAFVGFGAITVRVSSPITHWLSSFRYLHVQNSTAISGHTCR